jgi:hypothetical protein
MARTKGAVRDGGFNVKVREFRVFDAGEVVERASVRLAGIAGPCQEAQRPAIIRFPLEDDATVSDSSRRPECRWLAAVSRGLIIVGKERPRDLHGRTALRQTQNSSPTRAPVLSTALCRNIG